MYTALPPTSTKIADTSSNTVYTDIIHSKMPIKLYQYDTSDTDPEPSLHSLA